jgi:hypothetical protein
MSQSDFLSLAVQSNSTNEIKHSREVYCICAENQTAFTSAFLTSACKGDKVSINAVGFIPDAVYPHLEARKSPDITTTSMFNPMDLDAVTLPFAEDIYEPVRCMKVAAPPKRFYRTFWRSASRRILALSERAHDVVDMNF